MSAPMEARTCPGCGDFYAPRSEAEAERCWMCLGLEVPGATAAPARSPAGGTVTASLESRRALLDALVGHG